MAGQLSCQIMLSVCVVLFTLPTITKVSSLRVRPHDKSKRFCEVGSDLLLTCNYALENDNLYTLKWYREDDEFYRYSPGETPSVIIFPLKGIEVDTLSSPRHLRIKNMTRSSAGNYTCEISGGPPRFQTAKVKSEVIVGDLPKESPKIKGVKSRYYLGDQLMATCQTEPSYPDPVVNWWINDHAADPKYITSYDKFSRNISFKVNEKHVGKENTLKVKCTVEIFDLYWRSSEVATQISSIPSYSLPAYYHPVRSYASAAGSSLCHVLSLVIFSRLVDQRLRR